MQLFTSSSPSSSFFILLFISCIQLQRKDCLNLKRRAWWTKVGWNFSIESSFSTHINMLLKQAMNRRESWTKIWKRGTLYVSKCESNNTHSLDSSKGLIEASPTKHARQCPTKRNMMYRKFYACCRSEVNDAATSCRRIKWSRDSNVFFSERIEQLKRSLRGWLKYIAKKKTMRTESCHLNNRNTSEKNGGAWIFPHACHKLTDLV